MMVRVDEVRDIVASAGGTVVTRTDVLASSLGLAEEQVFSCLLDAGLQVVAIRDQEVLVRLSDTNRAPGSGEEPVRPGEESSYSGENGLGDVSSEDSVPDSIGDQLIDELELPVRAHRVLTWAGLRRIEDVAAASDDELLGLEGLGVTSLQEIREALRAHGVSPRQHEKTVRRRKARSDSASLPPLSAGDAAMQMDCIASEASAEPLRSRATEYSATLTLAAHADRPLTHLERLCIHAVDRVGARAIVVLDLLTDHTLAGVGTIIGVSQERVRQIEHSVTEKLHLDFVVDAVFAGLADTLNTAVIDETRMAAQLGGSGSWSATNFVKVVLRLLGLETPRGFATRIHGYWTAEPNCVVERLTRASLDLPFPEGDLATHLIDLALPLDFPLDEVTDERGSPIRLHPVLNLWVRARAVHRDAAWLLLKKHGQPAPATALAELLRIKRHDVTRSLRRDERFRQVRPSGLWVLAEWTREVAYESTLDAACAALKELGPMRYEDLEREVIRRYPVSSAAVRQTLISVEIGKWPDGRIDLRMRGAPEFPEPMPRRSSAISVDEDDGQLHLVIDVTHEVMRGSGIPIPTYVTWWLGLREAPSVKAFNSRLGRIVVRRNVGGAAVSSLRTAAERLGATPGCRLVLTLSKRHGDATVDLVGGDHSH
jgi:hypothetical protein